MMHATLPRSMPWAAGILGILAVGGAASAAPALFGAQPVPAPTSHRAYVILVDRLDVPSEITSRATKPVPAPRAIVVRRPAATAGPANMILVTRTTTPDDLDKAASQLANSIKRTPTVRSEMRAYVAAARRNPAAGKDRARANNDLRKLAAAEEYLFAGFGRHKAISISLKVAATR